MRLPAQTVESPATPLVFHAASRSLRPVVGMAGSAYLGAAVREEVDFASIAPDRRTLFVQAGAASLLMTGASTAEENSRELSEAISGVDQLLWSADGQTAILFASAGPRLQWLAGGQAGAPVELPEGARLLAAYPDGRTAILTVAGHLYRVTPDTALEQIGVFENPAAAVTDGSALYVADAATGQVYAIETVDGAMTQRPLLAEGEAVEDPSSMLLSADGGTLYVALRSARLLRAYAIASGTATAELSLDAEPTAFVPLARGGFLLNPVAAAGEPFSVVNFRNGLTTAFIPTGDLK
jgi:DNA-binding beta-propeller fold protein YncE